MSRAIPASQHVVDYDVAIEVATHEALIRQTYKDSVGVLTWCVGMTNATGHRVERYIGKPASLAHCMRLYAWALTSYAEQVKQAFGKTKLTKAQFAAAVSFHWNTGAIGRASWVKHFKAGRIADARKAIMNWTSPASLTERRKKERALFFDGVWSNNGTMPEYTRVTSRMTPVWSSRVQTDVSAELRAAFARIEAPVIDDAPKPDNKPKAPTVSPQSHPTDAEIDAALDAAIDEEIEKAPAWVDDGDPFENPSLTPVDADRPTKGARPRNVAIGGGILVALAAVGGWIWDKLGGIF